MKNINKLKQAQKKRRHKRVRIKLSGSSVRPRLSVYRSLSHIYAQLIDDVSGKTLASAKDTEIVKKATKSEKSAEVGKLLAQKAVKVGISEVVFDRGSYKYHGRVKALADGAREGGLKF